MNTRINISAFAIESIGCNLDIFRRWKNAILQMLETWLSKERFLSNSTLTDDEELTAAIRDGRIDPEVLIYRY